MSALALKNFFAHQREVNARREAYYARLEEELRNPPVEVVDTTAFDKAVQEFDFLLKRNWFLDEEDIRELLWDADEDVFQEIVNRINTYPFNVRQVIFGFLPLPLQNVKLKIRDLSDDEMKRREVEQYTAIQKMLEDAWENHKKTLQPPVGDLDSEMDDMFAKLQATKKELEDVKKKSLTGRYVPPGMRDKVVADDPNVLAVTKKIQTLENEIETQKQYIEQSNNAWFLNKRNEFEQQMLSL